MWNVLLQRTHSMAGCPEQCVRCISACWAITGNEKVMACGSAVDVTLNSHLIPDVEQGASSFCTFLFLLSHFFCVFFITSLKIKPGKTTCTCLHQRLALVVFSVALVKPLYVTNIDTDILWFLMTLWVFLPLKVSGKRSRWKVKSQALLTLLLLSSPLLLPSQQPSAGLPMGVRHRCRWVTALLASSCSLLQTSLKQTDSSALVQEQSDTALCGA